MNYARLCRRGVGGGEVRMDFIQLLHQALELTNKKAQTQGMFSLNTRKERGDS
jgi:hypothetical protein